MRYFVALAFCLVHTLMPAAVAAQPSPCNLSAGSLWQPNEGPTDYNLHLQPTGQLKAVMIFVDFPDALQSETTASLHDLLVPSSVSWYDHVSSGQMSLSVTPVHAWFRMPKNSTEYGFPNMTFAKHRAYIADAIAVSDAAIDFSLYQIVYVVAATHSALTYSPAFHAYPGTGIAVDGVEIRHAATFGEDIRVARPDYGSHVLIHETGHLIGLPDLYEYGAPDLETAIRFVGGWDPMSFVLPGAHFNAWHKRKLGWLDATDALCMSAPGALEETLTPMSAAGGIKVIIVPLGPSQAYVLEVRKQTGRDSRLCDKGVLIYTVDASMANGAGPIEVKPAQHGTDLSKIDACGPLYDAPFDLGAGEVSTYTDAAVGLTVEVLAPAGAGYLVRVTREGSSTPDLLEMTLTNPPAILALKQKVNLTDTVKNEASVGAGATTTRFYLSLDQIRNAGDKLLAGKRAVPALAAGATSAGLAKLTVATSTKLGTYYVLVCADDLEAQAESDENNNCRSSTTTVDVRAPDVTETTISNPPGTAARGTGFSVNDTARNQGNLASGATTTRFYLSLDGKKSGSDILLSGTRAVPGLNVNSDSNGNTNVTIPVSTAPAMYYVLACADDLKKSAESNEKNNCKSSTTRVSVTP